MTPILGIGHNPLCSSFKAKGEFDTSLVQEQHHQHQMLVIRNWSPRIPWTWRGW